MRSRSGFLYFPYNLLWANGSHRARLGEISRCQYEAQKDMSERLGGIIKPPSRLMNSVLCLGDT
jgi:hypothetical protein